MQVFVLTTSHGEVVRVIQCDKELSEDEVETLGRSAHLDYNQQIQQASVVRVSGLDGALAAIKDANPELDDSDD